MIRVTDQESIRRTLPSVETAMIVATRRRVLKNSIEGFLAQNLVYKFLKLSSTQRLKLAKITALVPFSTPTGVDTPSPQ